MQKSLNKISIASIAILLFIVIVDSYLNPAPYSLAVRSLALAIGLLAGITVRKP